MHSTDGFPESILKYLEGKGHNISLFNVLSVVQGIKVDRYGNVTAHGDSRKLGLGVVVDTRT